jgi:hypothetical protein
MHIKQISKFTEALEFAQGEHARDEALRMADLFEKTGDMRMASDWRKAVGVLPSLNSAEIRNAA